jgi:hypothetical protein
MSRLGVAEDIAELGIGHVRADLIARYNKDQAWEGRCDAFARVSAHIATLIGARGAPRSSRCGADGRLSRPSARSSR